MTQSEIVLLKWLDIINVPCRFWAVRGGCFGLSQAKQFLDVN